MRVALCVLASISGSVSTGCMPALMPIMLPWPYLHVSLSALGVLRKVFDLHTSQL